MKVVITDCDHPDVATERRIFGRAGLDVELADCRTEDDVIAAGRDAVALLTQYAPVTARVLAGLPRCRAVGRYGTGVDNIDVGAARAAGVSLVSVPDYALEEVANHTVALILAVTRGVVRLDAAVHGGHWDFRRAGRLRRASAQQLGVVGLGHIGAAVARRALALGYAVAGYDPVSSAPSGVRAVPLDEVLAGSDIVSLHVPLTEVTRRMMDDAAFARMRPGSVLVNTARGGLVDTAALARALDSGRLAGAALDVLDPEPPEAGDPVLADDRIIVTPHAAFYSEESLAELKRRVAEGLVAAARSARTAAQGSRA
jgi:D-3-phosphoglycerate dehydrogenase / 2-oxoglutarate reductase